MKNSTKHGHSPNILHLGPLLNSAVCRFLFYPRENHKKVIFFNILMPFHGRCPHINFTGNICVYCPGGPDSDFEYSTQSYTGYEPTSMRAIRARYDPYLQTVNRLAQLSALGHSIDKVWRKITKKIF